MQETSTPTLPDDDKPLEPIFEFRGIDQREQYFFANVHVRIAPEDPALGYFNADLCFPVRPTDHSQLGELREQALELARQTLSTSHLLPLLSASRRS